MHNPDDGAGHGTDRAGPALPALDGPRRPLVALTVTLLSCFCLLLAGLQGWSAWHAYRTRLEDSRVATANMTRALASHAETSIKLGDAVLAEMVERIEHDGLDDAATERLTLRLRGLTHDVGELHGLFVYGPDGKWLTSSLPRPMQGNNFDREYFQYHLLHPGRGTHVSVPVRSRSTGVWILPLSRRIEAPDGTFAGVVLATLNLGWFGRFYDSFDVGKNGTILLALDNGTLVYRRPFHDDQVGMDIRNSTIWKRAQRSSQPGSAVRASRIDNIERLYSYRHLAGFPLFVASGEAKDEILAGWRRSTLQTGVLVLAAICVLAWGGVLLVRQIRVRERLEHDLRRAGAALQRHNASLQNLADSDALTNLANRRLFEDRLVREYDRARRSGAPFALVMADIDHFKQYNDHYGHPAGDECLRKVAGAVAEGARRPADLAARYGGEEFAVILADTDLAGANAVADRIRATVAGLDLRHPDSPSGRVTLSMGLYVGHPSLAERNDPLAWVDVADRLLYEAKDTGRNRVVAREGHEAAA
jgi:diguanylate cyclase (GGDEF)-like protein